MILSYEIRRRQEEAAAEGRAQGMSTLVKCMLSRGKSIQQIAEDTGLTEEKIRSLAEMKA